MCIGYAMKHFLNIGDDDSICRLEFYVTKSIGNVTAELNKYWRKYRISPKFKENPKWHDEFSKEKTIIICIRNSVWIVWWNWLIERFQNNKLKKNSLYIIAFDVAVEETPDLSWRIDILYLLLLLLSYLILCFLLIANQWMDGAYFASCF